MFRQDDAFARPDDLAGYLDVLDGHPAPPQVHDGQVPQQFLDGTPDQFRVVAAAYGGELIRVAQQGIGAEGDHVRGGLMPGEQQEQPHAGKLRPRQLADGDLLGRYPGEQAAVRVGELSLDQVIEVCEQFVLGCQGDVHWRAGVDQDPADPLEEVVVGVGDAEELADHKGRHWQGERRDQVSGIRPGQHVVDELIDDMLDAWPHLLDPANGERCGDHAAKPRVLGVIHRDEAQHTVAPGMKGLALGGIALPGRIGADAAVGQQSPLLGIPRDEPGRAAVPQAHLGQRPVRP
jgi:hypothetical protein